MSIVDIHAPAGDGYGVIYADPPWSYRQQGNGAAARHYPTMTPDEINNLMPSCRMCNHYKRAHSLETFRRYIAEIPHKLQENYIFKVGVVYGNVQADEKEIKFYFERVQDHDTALL